MRAKPAPDSNALLAAAVDRDRHPLEQDVVVACGQLVPELLGLHDGVDDEGIVGVERSLGDEQRDGE